MRKRYLTPLLGLALAAAALASAVNAPAEVLENLEFFSDFELLTNLEILESGGAETAPEVSTGAVLAAAPAVSTAATAAVRFSTETVKISTFTRRAYEKR